MQSTPLTQARPATFALPRVASVGVAAFLVVLLGLGLRLWGVWYGLPFVYQTDEPFLVGSAWHMYQTGDMSPHFWDYPSLQIYSILVFIWVREHLSPLVPSLAANGEVLLIRLLNVAYATATIYFVYRVGARLFDRWAGVAGAALLALSVEHNLMSHFGKVDVAATFFAVATVAASVRLLDRPSWRAYALAGSMVGLATAAKYPVASICVVVIVAHVLAWRTRAVWQVGRLLLAGACAFAAFAIASPYTLIDLPTFLREFNSGIVDWAATGHDGAEGSVTAYYLRWLFVSDDGLIGWVAVLGAVIGWLAHRRAVALLAIFPIVFFLELTVPWNVRFQWYLLPMYPCLAVLGGYGVAEGTRRLARIERRAAVAWMVVLLVLLGWQAASAWDVSSALAQEEVRTTALHWIQQNVPPGSKIVREGYTPELGAPYDVTLSWRAIDKDPEWYRTEKVQYLVLGNFLYQRYFDDPIRYAKEVARYQALMDQGELIKRVEGPEMGSRNGVVLIYRLPQ